MSNQFAISSERENMSISPINEFAENQKKANLETYAYIYQCLTNEEPPAEAYDNVFSAVYEAMLKGVEAHERLFKVDADLLNKNAELQQQLTKLQGELAYVPVPTGASNAEIAKIQVQNQQIDAEKSKFQGLVAVHRQNASLAMSKINVAIHSETRLTTELNGFNQNVAATNEACINMNKKNN